jgi:hypothetical protein
VIDPSPFHAFDRLCGERLAFRLQLLGPPGDRFPAPVTPAVTTFGEALAIVRRAVGEADPTPVRGALGRLVRGEVRGGRGGG